jgi:hypothetical protein
MESLAFCGLSTENDFMVIQGRIQDGVVVLENNVSVPEGTEVTVVVRAAPEPAREIISEAERRRVVEIMDRIAALPDENPGDTFSGAEHDRVLYGAP